MKILLTTFGVFFSGLLLTGCERRDSDRASESRGESSASREVPVQTFQAVGVIRRVDPERNIVVIEHEEINGFMEAMTMPFHVRDGQLLSGLAPGDKVKFTLNYSPDELLVTAIQKLP